MKNRDTPAALGMGSLPEKNAGCHQSLFMGKEGQSYKKKNGKSNKICHSSKKGKREGHNHKLLRKLRQNSDSRSSQRADTTGDRTAKNKSTDQGASMCLRKCRRRTPFHNVPRKEAVPQKKGAGLLFKGDFLSIAPYPPLDKPGERHPQTTDANPHIRRYPIIRWR